MKQLHDDEYWIRQALAQAEAAAAMDEVPIGAVAVHDGVLVAAAHNRTITDHDPSAHAEVMTLRRLGQALGNHRMNGVRVYVTLEPCVMCAGVILAARIPTVMFGAWDEKAGAAGSVLDVLRDTRLPFPRVEVIAGVRYEESRALLEEFFLKLRGNGER